jgi:hypothetical protein
MLRINLRKFLQDLVLKLWFQSLLTKFAWRAEKDLPRRYKVRFPQYSNKPSL